MKLEWLDLRPDVRLTPNLERNLPFLDPFFENLPTAVTSGFRDSREQVDLILQLARKNGLWGKFPELSECENSDPAVKVSLTDGKFYWWQRAWSELLHIGVIINPPLLAECLTDYVRPNGEKMKGKVMQPSLHPQGFAADLSASSQMQDKQERLVRAKSSGVITSFTIERKQNCLHVNFPNG